VLRGTPDCPGVLQYEETGTMKRFNGEGLLWGSGKAVRALANGCLFALILGVAANPAQAYINQVDPGEHELPPGDDPGPTPTEPTGLRTGMTWTVLGQQNGYVHVGADGQTNAYSGDTTIDQFLPILCVLADGRTAPGGFSFDYYNGWARGAVRATAAVQGTVLTSQAQGDSICATTFGAGWRMAEFHDGRYGLDFSWTGGWSWWAEGNLVSGSRFWMAINDQPANPWNSAGDIPPSNPTSSEDILLKTRLQELVQPMLAVAQNPQFRDLVFTGVARRFDGDDNVLLTDVIAEAEQTQIVDTGSAAWQSLKAKVAQLQNMNGQTYYPQIYIPNFGDGAVRDPEITLVVLETDLSRTQLPAYQISPSGDVQIKAEPVDEAYAEAHEVWVMSVNERVGLSSSDFATVRALDSIDTTARKQHVDKPVDYETGEDIICNPTGLRNNMGREYLMRFVVPNPSSVEHWTAGKLEPRVIIVGKGGAEVKNAYFGKIKRKDVKNWYYTNLFLTTWDRAVWGDSMVYKWVEEDHGPNIQLSLGLSNFQNSLLGLPFNANVTATFASGHDDMGSGVVTFSDSTYQDYGTGVVNWTTCSVGGDGGTGNSNLALSAIVAASSTYSGYSPARANDGSQSTNLGGAYSWANAAYPPQWIQLDFGTPKTFSKVVIYTSAGYPIRDFDIEVWNGSNWVTVDSVPNNTSLVITRNITLPGGNPVRLVRIWARSGPTHQPGYVRVNEFEVY
jgi:hypothetical protein